MSYATAQDWIEDNKALHHIADVDGDGSPDLAEIEKALDTAAAEMEGWLYSRYPTVPNRATATLRMHQLQMATHHLAKTAQSTTDDIKDAYKASINYLMKVSDGKADLPGTDAGGDLDAGSGGVQMEAPDRLFTRDSLKDF